MMKRARGLVALVLAGFILTLTACGNADDSSVTDVTKSIAIGSGQTCATLNPLNVYDGWYTVRFGLGQTLTRMEDDLSIAGWLVESDYSSNEDNTQWTFTIRDGITFSNGKPVDAAAVKSSLENVCNNAVRSQDYFTPSSIEADGQTLIINTDIPEPILPNKLADPLFVIIDTTQDMTNIDDQGPVGTGPFVVKSYDQLSKEVVVVKNENYWGDPVQVDEISFTYTEDQSVLTNALKMGEFDAVYNISMTDVKEFEESPDYTVVKTASGRTTHGFMNQNGPLADKALREAILESVDRATVCEVQLNGQYVAGKTLVTPAADYGYDELEDSFSYDIDRAKKTLDDAGYKDVDGDGFLETPEGDPLNLKFTYYTGRPEQEIFVTASVMALSELGINCEADLHDSETVGKMLAAGDFDLLCMSINVLNCADPENHMATYFKTGGANATYGWSNVEFDDLMERLHVTADPAERRNLVKQCEQILLDEAVCMYFCYPIMNFTMKNNVNGITSTPADYYWVSEYTQVN